MYLTSFTVPMLAAFFAGIMGAFVGGGSMITVPSLMVTGLLPINALASAKTIDLVSVLSSASAYWRANVRADKSWFYYALPMLVGAIIGNYILQHMPNDYLKYFVPFVLMLCAAYFVFSPHLNDDERLPSVSNKTLAVIFLALGFYNGFFGPGIAILIVACLNRLAGYGLRRAVGVSKMVVLPANIAIFIGFAIGGHIIWPITIMCCVLVTLGTQLGARFAIKGGAKIIKPIAATLCITLSLKLLFF